MKDEEEKTHTLKDEPLGTEGIEKNEKPVSLDDKRPADLEIPKGDHPDTDTSRAPGDWENETPEASDD
ncbi:hypothetical protein [Pedobacter endophyticus]|uniref:Uncharacterized protein n=1 Tax=Pedobacter endophyticus TaxID=2789740 RepID=A0A7S9L1P2_9SPHI|nr:hypothetical protein [Pedobacter endophyticus]QPH40481.1 hypothetical protein IZT61_04145 [Pedobacter endophyticus]